MDMIPQILLLFASVAMIKKLIGLFMLLMKVKSFTLTQLLMVVNWQDILIPLKLAMIMLVSDWSYKRCLDKKRQRTLKSLLQPKLKVERKVSNKLLRQQLM